MKFELDGVPGIRSPSNSGKAELALHPDAAPKLGQVTT